MRIGIFVALLPPEHRGGAELQADRLARELAARGHDVHVFARRQPGRGRDEVRDGVSIHRRRVVPLPLLRPLCEMLQGAMQARRVRPHVLLCFMTFHNGFLGWLASRLTGAPFVVWQRIEAEGLLHTGRFGQRLAFALQARADGLWVQAESFAARLRAIYRDAGRAAAWRRLEPRLRVVGNGIDLPPEPGVEPPPPWRFLFVGRLVPQKDLPTLLRAAALRPECEVWIAGDGPLADALREATVSPQVRFLGPQAPEAIPDLLRQCRALVLCSLHEGVPNVVLEALAHSRPVVATPVGAIPELVQDGVSGRLVPVGDAERLAAALDELRDEATWRRWSKAARRPVSDFAWPALVERVEAELSAVAAARRQQQPGLSAGA